MADETNKETDAEASARASLTRERWRRTDEVELKRLDLDEREIEAAPARRAAHDAQVAAVTEWHKATLPLQLQHCATIQKLFAEQNHHYDRIATALEAIATAAKEP